MKNKEAYSTWSATYDIVLNKTRDLEAVAIRKTLSGVAFSAAVELGCGTGKNTEWLSIKANRITAIDFSDAMLKKAREKITMKQVSFIQADITKEWSFIKSDFDLVTCSLILEHIRDIDFVFSEASKALKTGGYFYVGELHPFKQYEGSKARFETAKGVFELECFIHHASDYFESAGKNGFRCIQLNEWFDENDRTTTPRILSFLFQKI